MSYRRQKKKNTNEAVCVPTKFSICPIIALAGDIYSDTVSTVFFMEIQNLNLQALLRLKSLNIHNHNLV